MASEPRHLPHQREAERAVLGAIILNGNDALVHAMEVASPDDFYIPQHAAVIRAMVVVHERGEAIDLVGLEAQLRRTGEIELVGGIDGLAKLDQYATAHNVKAHAALVRESAQIRGIVSRAREIAAAGMTEGCDAASLFAAARGLSTSTEFSPIGDCSRSPGDLVLESFSRFVRRGRGETDPACPTGIASLDSDLDGGWQPGKLYVVAARPGVGKTSMLTSGLAWSGVGEHAHPMHVSSLEMSGREIADRLLVTISRVQGSTFKSGRATASEFEALTSAATRIHASPFRVDDRSQAFAAIESNVERWAAHHARPYCDRWADCHPDESRRVPVAWIDYLQLCQLDGKGYANREERVAAMTRRLKLLSVRAGVAIVLLSQINRESVKANRRPRSSDLRESGAVEQDADSVALLHRDIDPAPPTEGERRLAPDEIEIILDKNRGGPTGLHLARWVGHRTAIEDRGASW